MDYLVALLLTDTHKWAHVKVSEDVVLSHGVRGSVEEKYGQVPFEVLTIARIEG